MRHTEVKIAVPALRVIGNFLSSPEAAITSVPINAGVLPLLNECMAHPKQILRKETAWALANVTAESPERVQQCIDVGIIQSLI